MPQFWIAIFFIFLAVAELYQSIKDIDLPLPVYLGLGTILAIASNYQQQFLFDSGLGAAAPVAHRQINPLQSITADPALSSMGTPLLAVTQPPDVD
jgi:hypothetical protein